MISVLLTVVMISFTTFLLKADAVKLQNTEKKSDGVRSILSDSSCFTVNLDNNVIYISLKYLGFY